MLSSGEPVGEGGDAEGEADGIFPIGVELFDTFETLDEEVCFVNAS